MVAPAKRKAMGMDTEVEDGAAFSAGDGESDCSDTRTVSSTKRDHSNRDSTKKGSRSSAGSGRHKPKGAPGKMKMYCRGCGKTHPAEEFAANQVLCAVAKAAKDNLRKQAVRQQCIEWFEEVEQDEKRFQHLIAVYNAKKQTSRRCKFQFCQYREKFETASEVLMDDEGELMHEDGYYTWATTKAAVTITRSQAQTNWAAWKARIATDPKAIIHDNKGPVDSPFQIRVKTSSKVTFRSRYTKVKQHVAGGALNKKVDADAMIKGHADIMKGHDDMQNGGDDLSAIAAGMLATGVTASSDCTGAVGPASAFESAGLGGIQSMMEGYSGSEETEDDSENPDEDPEGKKEGKTNNTPTKDKKEGKASTTPAKEKGGDKAAVDHKWSREDAMTSAQRSWLMSVQKLQSAISAEEVAADVIIAAAEEMGCKNVVNAYILCCSRVRVAKLLCMPQPVALKKLIADINSNRIPDVGLVKLVESASGGDATASTDAAPAAFPLVQGELSETQKNLLKAAPCSCFQDLRTFAELRSFSSKFEDIAAKADVKKHNEQLKVFVNAGRQLTLSIKKAFKELDKAVNNHKAGEEASQKASKDKDHSVKRARKSAKRIDSPAESIQDKGHPMLVLPFDSDELKGHEFFKDGAVLAEGMQPYMITGVPWAKEVGRMKDLPEKAESPVLASLKLFYEDFQQSDVRKQAGRCQRQNLNEETQADANALDYLNARLLPLCPQASISANSLADLADDNQLRKAMALSNFAAKQGSHHAYVDKGKLASLRISTEGTRLVAATSLHSLTEFMKLKNVNHITPTNFFKAMRMESTTEYAADNKLYWATVGVGDALFIPSGFLIYESVQDDMDVVGMKMSIIISRDQKGIAAFKQEADLPSTPEAAICKQVVKAATKAAE